MRRRVLARVFLFDLASLTVGVAVASWIVFDTPLPTRVPPFRTSGGGLVPLIGFMFAGMVIGTVLSRWTIGPRAPRPSYGRALFIATTTAMVTPATIVFTRTEYFSRPFIAITVTVMFGLSLAHRAVLRSRPWSEMVLVVTSEKRLIDDLLATPHARVVDILDPASQEVPARPEPGTTLAVDLRAVLSEEMAQFVASSNLAGYPVRSLSEVYEEHTGRMAIVHLAEGWELRTPVEQSASYLPVKAALDLTLTLLLAPIWVPLGALIWCLVKLDSPGPGIFSQTRVGHDGETFTMYKFRTMRADAEREGPQMAAVDDERLTRVGRMLRKVRADEIPQLINVLKREVSLVGPRPEQPEFVRQFSRAIPFYDYRHLVRPGITGWAQVNFGYADDEVDTVEKLMFDLYYVKNMSLWLDLNILGKSMWTVLSRFGAQ